MVVPVISGLPDREHALPVLWVGAVTDGANVIGSVESTPIFRCGAIALSGEQVTRYRRPISNPIVLLGAVLVTLSAAAEHGRSEFKHQPGLWFVIAVGLCQLGLAAQRRIKPLRRGRLELFADGLLFRFTWRHAHLPIPLVAIDRIGLRQNRIHVSLRHGGDMFFCCSPWRAEDMFDAISATMEDGDVDYSAHELS